MPGRLHLLLKGTNFQIKVWEALLKIPPAALVSYGRLAGHLGMTAARRAPWARRSPPTTSPG
jgi:AraC family transcriptional regulator of adaptative response/methylated-DNA-[protein]-cysteine methyltransferase